MPHNRYLQLLTRYLTPLWPGTALLTALVAGGVALQLAAPQILRSFIDVTQTAPSPDAIGPLAVLYLAVELLRRAATLGASYVGAVIGGSATNALRSDLLRHCLLLDMPFHKRHTPGELVERLSGDVGSLANFFSQFAVRIASDSLLIVGILALLFREDWRVGLGLTAYAGLTFATLRAIQPLAVRRGAAAREASAAQMGFLEERLRGTEDIRASGAEAHVLHSASQLAHTLLLRQRAAQLVSQITAVAGNFLFAAGTATGLLVGAILFTRGDATVGTAFLIVAYTSMLVAPLDRIREQAQDFQGASASIGRIDHILTQTPTVANPPPTTRATLPAGPPSIQFDQVSFHYEDSSEESVLDDVSFHLEPGHTLGLLGRTGSGKTTLTRLLFRLYDPTSGSIRLSGINLTALPLAHLRYRVALVTQDVQLFQTTVRDNVAFFDPSVPDAKIVAALEDVGLGPWYRTLPHGLDTPLGQGALGSYGLSAGEAQLLAFARVFLKDPDLVILDEASSRLDPATERLLERATDRLLGRDPAGGVHPSTRTRTAIVIAHRLDTIRRVDDVLILEDGRIAEHGPRETLAKDPSSRYSHLLRVGGDGLLAGGTEPRVEALA
jgi:ABC-type multidrug transport system fused ATPase/permease subunit